MKKIIICSLPLQIRNAKKYPSLDKSLEMPDKEIVFPVCGLLEKSLKPDDELTIVLIERPGKIDCTKENAETFKSEFMVANSAIGAKYQFVELKADFSETREVQTDLLNRIIDCVEPGMHIIADITYGTKDIPILTFAACNFAEKFLNCEIDNIVYGQAEFNEKNEVVNTQICDMVPLYYLNSITNTIECDEPDKAKHLLKTLTSM